MTTTTPTDDLVKVLDALNTAPSLSTSINKILPPATSVSAIPARVGTASADVVINAG